MSGGMQKEEGEEEWQEEEEEEKEKERKRKEQMYAGVFTKHPTSGFKRFESVKLELKVIKKNFR